MKAQTPGDPTEVVLERTKGLLNNFDSHYDRIRAKVTAGLEGPCKSFTVEDGIPLLVQLSHWDQKLGPQAIMMVGDQVLFDALPRAVVDQSTKMLDVLDDAGACDLSRSGVSRLLARFPIDDKHARGGLIYFLIAVYYSPAADLPKDAMLEVLTERTKDLRGRGELVDEIGVIPNRFDAVNSEWKSYLFLLREMLWAVAGSGGPGSRPGARVVFPPETEIVKEAPIAGEPGEIIKRPATTFEESAFEQVREREHGNINITATDEEPEAEDGEPPDIADAPEEAEPFAIPEESPEEQQLAVDMKTTAKEITTTLRRPFWKPKPKQAKAPSPPEQGELDDPSPVDNLSSGEPEPTITAMPGTDATKPVVVPAAVAPKSAPFKGTTHVEIFGKLKMSGYSLRIDEKVGAGTACKLVDVGSATVALFLSFSSKFPSAGTIDVVSGRFFGPTGRIQVELHVPEKNVAIHAHISGAVEMLAFGTRGGRFYNGKLLHPVVVPVAFARGPITRDGASIPFAWSGPEEKDGEAARDGFFLVDQSCIDRFDKFLLASLGALSGPVINREAAHAGQVSTIAKKLTNQSRAIGVVQFLLCGIALVASFHCFPVGITLALLEDWYVLAGLIAGVFLAWAYFRSATKKALGKATEDHVAAVSPNTPFLIEPDVDAIMDAATRLGRESFAHFRLAFCQHVPVAELDNIELQMFGKAGTATANAGRSALASLIDEPRTAVKPSPAPATTRTPDDDIDDTVPVPGHADAADGEPVLVNALFGDGP
jgi:hypothetical protein